MIVPPAPEGVSLTANMKIASHKRFVYTLAQEAALWVWFTSKSEMVGLGITNSADCSSKSLETSITGLLAQRRVFQVSCLIERQVLSSSGPAPPINM